MPKTISPKPTNSIFNMPEEKVFSETESIFFMSVLNEEKDFLMPNVKHIIKKHSGNRTRLLHELADFFRYDVVECYAPSIEKMECEAYEEIVNNAIHAVDNFKVAEEILKQYEAANKNS